ncbi:MAG: hypothetical protein QOK37_3574 [Thermoanaerobaculia bacterium]|jgi:hypothetical protein|nr:hypothetical protein [Thermoanaerobaculia bacterium]
MLRKLNFTERTSIARSACSFELRRDPDGVLAFDAKIDLAGVTAPAGSRIFIEAQYRTSYQRFDCGLIGALSIPHDRRLTEIDSDRVVRFRVKVVDQSAGARRVVASSNDIVVSCDRGGDGARLSLLPVNFTDLDDQVWRIHFEADQPVLELNNRIDAIERLARSDPQFFALVYPAAIREVLTRYLVIDRWEDGNEESEWPDLWIRWARDLTGDAVPSDADERAAWIDDVIAAFCGLHRAAEKMRASFEDPS